MPRADYDKKRALEYIFNSKVDKENPQQVIPFTKEEVAGAIIATGGVVPHNLNNFVKDLCRAGNTDPRVDIARSLGYRLRESTSSHRMFGEFFLGDQLNVVEPTSGLVATEVTNRFADEVADIVRPDEGGIAAAIEACHLLDLLLGFDPAERRVWRVQSPVKLQPYEIDGLWLFSSTTGERVLVPVEAKSGRDVITVNQLIGNTRTALESVAPGIITQTVPVGAKLLASGDLYLVAFPSINSSQLDQLTELIRPENRESEMIFRITPLPPQWASNRSLRRRQASG